MFYIVR